MQGMQGHAGRSHLLQRLDALLVGGKATVKPSREQKSRTPGGIRLAWSVVMALKTTPVARGAIGAAIDVHRALGPGLFEHVYRACLYQELLQRGLQVEAEVSIPVRYRDARLDCGFRVDFVVNQELLIEVKAVDAVHPVHRAQVLTYLRFTGLHEGLLMNFNVTKLTDGLTSVVL